MDILNENSSLKSSVAYILMRSKKCDEYLFWSIEYHNVKQVIILGAGYDSRAYRYSRIFNHSNDEKNGIQFYEIDLENTQRDKINLLEKNLTCEEKKIYLKNVHFIPGDFEKQSMNEIFDQAGINRNIPTAILWEGVTYYLTKEAVDNTLQAITNYFSNDKDTYLFFDFIDERVFENEFKKFRELLLYCNTPFFTGFKIDNFEQLLRSKGWIVLNLFTPEYIKNVYKKRPYFTFLADSPRMIMHMALCKQL